MVRKRELTSGIQCSLSNQAPLFMRRVEGERALQMNGCTPIGVPSVETVRTAM
jgi:hypothetical protein